MATEYPPMTPEQRELYARHSHGKATADDLIAMATDQADRAMRSLPPHCLPTDGGLPHNPDHANASAHRCWSFLRELAALRARGSAVAFCTKCPFAMHLHPTPPEAGSCPGYP
jgi:hypothetical protein